MQQTRANMRPFLLSIPHPALPFGRPANPQRSSIVRPSHPCQRRQRRTHHQSSRGGGHPTKPAPPQPTAGRPGMPAVLAATRTGGVACPRCPWYSRLPGAAGGRGSRAYGLCCRRVLGRRVITARHCARGLQARRKRPSRRRSAARMSSPRGLGRRAIAARLRSPGLKERRQRPIRCRSAAGVGVVGQHARPWPLGMRWPLGRRWPLAIHWRAHRTHLCGAATQVARVRIDGSSGGGSGSVPSLTRRHNRRPGLRLGRA